MSLRRLWEFAVCLTYDIIQLVHDIWQVRLAKLHTKILRESEGLQADPRSGQFAVVALYPSDASLPFTMNLLRSLSSCGIWTLVVSTRKLGEEQRECLLRNCHHLIERVGVGRDFGSYKLGLEWLDRNKGLFSSADRLILTNDSLFYPKAFEGDLAEILAREAEWQSLFENYQHHYHAQSFFLAFGAGAFSSRAFRDFWRNYRPYSSRVHSINRGEVELSKKLLRAGFMCEPIYSSVRLVMAMNKSNWSTERLAELSPSSDDWETGREAVAQSMFGNSSIPLPTSNKYHDADIDHKASDERYDYLFRIWVSRVGRKFEISNPTHGAALLCNVLLGAPLKRDICYRGTYDVNQVVRLAEGFDSDEIKAIYRDLRARGLPVSLRRIRRILWSNGRI